MAIRVGINGFGRIGRLAFRSLAERPDAWKAFEVMAINDIAPPATLAHLLKYDSVHGRFPFSVDVQGANLVVNGRTIQVTSEKDPAKLPWKALGVEYVFECTGRFTDREKATWHLSAGARKVLISAPAKGEDLTVVMGVNEGAYDPEKHHVISNASCTTNCLAVVCKALMGGFGIERALMTTIHAYTNDQRVQDLEHKDLRRARAAAVSMIPTTTGAAKAVALVIPELKGKVNGFAMRVPVPNVSIVDLTADLNRPATVEELNGLFKRASQSKELGNVLGYSEEPLVSVDFNHSAKSAEFDALSTMVIGERMVKLLAWYDNEWGYSNRLVDLAAWMAARERSTVTV